MSDDKIVPFPTGKPSGPTCRHGILAGHCPDCPLDRPWLCALKKDYERWEWGGATMDDAINAGLALWGGENRPDGFWVAPSHASKSEDDSEKDYTVESDKAEWIPLN